MSGPPGGARITSHGRAPAGWSEGKRGAGGGGYPLWSTVFRLGLFFPAPVAQEWRASAGSSAGVWRVVARSAVAASGANLFLVVLIIFVVMMGSCLR